MTDWVVRAIQREEGEVVPAVSLGGDMAVTPEGQQFRGRLLPQQEPEPGAPLLVTGTPGNYLLDTLSWDPAGSPAGSSAYSPVVLDSQRGRRCGLCVALDDLFPVGIRNQKWASFVPNMGGVELAQRVPEGVRSVKVAWVHTLFLGIYSFDQCLRRDRQTGFWAKGRFAVPFPAPTRARVYIDIQLDNDNRWFSQSDSQSGIFDISIAGDGRWEFAWQGNPRQAPGIIIEIPGSDSSIDVGVFRLYFSFPLEADFATLVDLEMCFGNAGLRRIANG